MVLTTRFETPATSLTVLAVLLGTWFIIIGIFEIIGGIMLRRVATTADATLAGPAGRAMSTG